MNNRQGWIILIESFCILATAALVIVCLVQFHYDEDLTEVSFKRFLEDKESIYPEISICIGDAYLGENFRSFGDGINETTYEQFLIGKLWDIRMLDIDYNNVTINIEDFIRETCIKQEFFGDCKPFNATINTFVNQARKCITIHNLSLIHI